MSIYLDAIDAHGTNAPATRAFFNSRGQSLTYGELKERSDTLAHRLLERDDSRRPIVVYGHKSPLMLVCFLACAKSGHAYVPIDPAYPASRVIDICDQLVTPLVLDVSDDGLGEAAHAAEEVIDVTGLLANLTPATPDPSAVLAADETFYIIFTSGSTGKPKGVEITTDCVDNFWKWMSDVYDYPEPQVFFDRAPFSFDLSVTDVVLALGRGDAMFALEREDEDELSRAFDALRRSGVTFWVSTPSFADMCLHDTSFTRQLLPDVHTFFFVGETLKNETAAGLLERFEGCEVINGYGPTESCDLVASVSITPEMAAADEPLPVGTVKPGSALKVLDPDTLEEVPAGTPGELFILGDTVAKGYFGRSDLTDAAFHSCPAHIAAGQRSYRTGDAVVLDEQGMLHFHGRLDFQIKLHGFRIELGDIESNLEALDEVRAACVLPVMRKGSISHLNAYVVPASALPAHDERFAFGQNLRTELGAHLPAYMIPRKFVYLERFPLNVNGKIDRKALAEIR